jgi:hypothetical protein
MSYANQAQNINDITVTGTINDVMDLGTNFKGAAIT